MAQYQAQSEMDREVVFRADPAWVLPPVAEEDDDWSGVMGCCDALRPASPGPIRLPDDEDWGYGAEAH